MDREDVSGFVLSSVHIGTDFQAISGESTVISKFHYTIPPPFIRELQVDEDGDINVPRLKQEVIILEHTMATHIDRVGTQLWSASLLMADYIIHNRYMFSDAVVLELGSGCGFIGIVAGTCARHVFCTDINRGNILELCHCNIVQNNVNDNVSVHELDWFKSGSDQQLLVSDRKFTWQPHDVHMLSKTSIILACDVIYDNKITDAFLKTLVYLSTQILATLPTIIISLEKRINFTINDLAPSSHCYDYFFSCLNKCHTTAKGPTGCMTKWKFDVKLLPVSLIPQSFCYERIEQMEIWELNITKDV